jgi:hypothetical protein
LDLKSNRLKPAVTLAPITSKAYEFPLVRLPLVKYPIRG